MKTFETSHLLAKLKKMILVSRIIDEKFQNKGLVYKISTFDLDDKDIYEQIKKDYELVREVIISQGFKALTGKMGILIQPRTKGSGHGSISRAFYARKELVKIILDIYT